MKKTFLKAAGVVAVVAIAGIAGATYAGSVPGGDKPPSASPAGVAPASINPNATSELKFVPVQPCRAVDTRNAGGQMGANTNRGFDVFGTNLSGQGGSAAGCGVPSYAAAVTINVTSVSPGGTGYLRGTAQGAAAPTATLLSFASGPPRGNEVPLSVCRVSCTGGDEIRLYVYNASTHVVVDVLGYFVEPVFATVDGDDTTSPTVYRSSGVTSVTRTGVGVWNVVPARDVTGCAVNVTSGSSDTSDVPTAAMGAVEHFSPSLFQVEMYDADGAPVDTEFNFYAAC